MYNYRHLTDIPDAVLQARAVARSMGFTQSCSDETGRLLRVLAGHITTGTIGEIGTGCGEGAAWMASELAPDMRLVTVELDESRADAARTLFSDNAAITVLTGDWHQLHSHAPFAMLFVDGGKAKELDAPDCIDMMRLAGCIVLDDLTPLEQWPQEWQGKRDPVRDFWLNDPRVISTEVRVSPSMSVLLATRIK